VKVRGGGVKVWKAEALETDMFLIRTKNRAGMKSAAANGRSKRTKRRPTS